MTKRDLVVMDQSNAAVKLTLWGQQAEKFSASDFPVLALKGLRVSDYGGMLGFPRPL
jgi:replication factor A1